LPEGLAHGQPFGDAVPAFRPLQRRYSLALHDVPPAQSLGLTTVWVNHPSRRPGVGAVKAGSARAGLEVSTRRGLVDLVRVGGQS
jgi:hypothetical protein